MSENSKKPRKDQDGVVIRFAGDSGDGIQVTGDQFTQTAAALSGNDVHTFPDYPAEIRAPIGTLPGVSGFQVSFANYHVHTPGDQLDALVVMNPAALKVNLSDLRSSGILLINSSAFNEKELKKAGYETNPLDDESLSEYRVLSFEITKQTLEAMEDLSLSRPQASKCKNFYALGIVYWLYDKKIDLTLNWINNKFEEMIAKANIKALKAGYYFAETIELCSESYSVKPAALEKGTYRQITGNEAFGLACAAIAVQSQEKVFVAGYPITPSSSILHEVAKLSDYGVTTFQAEDEIAAAGAAIGASYGGSIGLTCTSGPGMDLKTEMIGLAMMVELPLVIIDVQRAGPSTGLPTKAEQSDLLSSIFGRHGESPLPVFAASSPGDCFNVLYKAAQVAIDKMTPVIVLSDASLANGAEPWKVPEIENLPKIEVKFAEKDTHKRDSKTLTKQWTIPGTKDLMYRLGGLEQDKKTGNISYDPENHHEMIKLRQAKVDSVNAIAPEIIGPEQGKCLVLSWGSTYGSVRAAVEKLNSPDVAMCHVRQLYPIQDELLSTIKKYDSILIPELNNGQFASLLKSKCLTPVISLNKMKGKPFKIIEICEAIRSVLEKGEANV